MIALFFTIIILLNFFFLNNFWVGFLGGSAYIFILGKKISSSWKLNLIFSLLLVLSFFSLSGAIVYFFYKLNNFSVAIIIILASLFIQKISKLQPNAKDVMLNHVLNLFQYRFSISEILSPAFGGLNLQSFFLIFSYLTLLFILFGYLFIFQTTETIRSPWQALPHDFFIFYFLATLFLFIIIFKLKSPKLLLLLSLHFFFTASVALFIYKIGYGFDQFIHIATEKEILKNGVIYPKPFYYLGQYSLVIILSKILFLPVAFLDKILVPLLFALTIPLAVYYFALKHFPKNLSLFASLLFLVFPLNFFILTTPQNLANLYLLFIIFTASFWLSFPKGRFILFFLSLTAFFIHPLSGLAALIFLALLFFSSSPKFLLPLVLGGALSFPAVFFLLSALKGLPFQITSFSLSALQKFLSHLALFFVNNFQLPLDILYFYHFNFYLFIFFVSLAALLYLYQKRFFFVCLLSFLVLGINFLILKFFFTFPFLINYEQGAYTQRIGEIAFYFLLPVALYSLLTFAQKISSSKIYLRTFFLFLAIFLISGTLYLRYPRQDDYETSHAFNTTLTDIKTVHWIAKDAQGKNFIVLANQQVSAAAIQEFGFKKYYGDQFYYPLPTSSALYKNYLQIVDKGLLEENLNQIFEKYPIKKIYLVVNRYWWNSFSLFKQAKEKSAYWRSIDGQDFVFVFDKKSFPLAK